MSPEWKPRSKRKRWARKGPTPNELFPALSATPLFGLLEGRFVWVPADERTAKLLDGACVGTPAGGARSAADAAGAAAAVFGAEAVSAAVSDERGGAVVCVRLSLEEAVFLVHVLGTLRLVVEQEAEEKKEKEEEGEEGEEEAATTTTTTTARKGEEEEPPARVAREMGCEELWRYACLKAGSKRESGGRHPSDDEDDDDDDENDDDDEAFLRSYAAFHHFRCKGWTVRSGLRYGCDYVLYQGHPASAHADVCVLTVRRGDGGRVGGEKRKTTAAATTTDNNKKQSLPSFYFSARESPSRQAGPLTWLDVEIGNRLAAQVGKRLLLLHVQVSGGEGGENGGEGDETPPSQKPLLSLTAAEALSRVTVEERLVERWVPDVDREEPVV